MKTIYKSFAIGCFMLFYNGTVFSQSCTDAFSTAAANITNSPYQTAFLSNGNIVVANYRSDNGTPSLTVDLFNVAKCKWTKSYTCPDVGSPDDRLQLLVANNDFISIKYTGSSYNNIIQLNKSLTELQRFQPNTNSWPQMQIALDLAGNHIVAKKKYNASYGRFDVEFQKFEQTNFSNLLDFSRTNISNISINTIDAITTDNNDDCIVSGSAYDSSTGNTVLYVTKFGSTGGIVFFTLLNWAGTITSGSELITDADNNILVAANMLNSKNLNITYKLDPLGTELWAAEKKNLNLTENNFWMTTDSSKSTYLFYNEATGNTFPASVAVIVKYLANGQKAWERNYKYMVAKSITTKDANTIIIGGSKYLTQKDFPSYRPYWQIIDLEGDELENGHDFFNVDPNTTLSYEGHFNQLVYNHDFKTLATIGIRKHILLNNTYTGYAFARSFDLTAAPKIITENITSFRISPNPVQNFITISTEKECLITKASISAIDGKIVFEKHWDNDANSIDVQYLQPGIYIVKLTTDVGVIANRFLKL